ncbi:hypothetical protein SEA_FEDE_17 [Microbacterium phage Fede]|nr:hypothetical protein SEA_FEDE_17 [Microbacterium phage Fede]
MARIITTEQPIVVKKERRLEVGAELQLMELHQIEERTSYFRKKEQIPDEVIMQRLRGENAWDVDIFVWEWWEITVG